MLYWTLAGTAVCNITPVELELCCQLNIRMQREETTILDLKYFAYIAWAYIEVHCWVMDLIPSSIWDNLSVLAKVHISTTEPFNKTVRNMLKHLSKPGLGREDMRQHWCLWELAWENTECSNCRYAMPSISFMNCKLLSGTLADNIVRACQHSSVNVKGNWHVWTATFSLSPPSQSRVDLMEESGTWNWSEGSNSIVSSPPRKLHFSHMSKEFPHLPPAQSHGNSYGLPLAMKGLGLLLCKPWKWSSHTVFVCTLGFIAPSECLQFNWTFLWECQALKFQHIHQLCWQQMIISKTKGYGASFGMQIVLGSQRRGMCLVWN